MAIAKRKAAQRSLGDRLQIAVDVGNRTVKYLIPGGEVKSMPSWHKDLEEWEDLAPEPDSAIVRYLEGDNVYLLGRAWAVGAIARDMEGTPTFKSEKALLAPKLVLGALETPQGKESAIVSRLVCSLPNDLQIEKVAAMIDGLRGIHRIQRNGNALDLDIQSVEVQPETLGAYRWALQQHQFRYARVNGILDLGGKTGIGQLYGANGTLIRESRTIVEGTYQLAQAIAQHPDFKRHDQPVNYSDIMDAIEDGSLYYSPAGIDFAHRLTPCVTRWLNTIHNKLRISWARWLPELGEVLVIGGSAHLADPLVAQTQGRFKVTETPQWCNVLGMLL